MVRSVQVFPLPSDVCQKLLGNRGFLDRNVLNEQPQHLLAVLGLRRRSVPYPRKVFSKSR
jgi:hypothetical protein